MFRYYFSWCLGLVCSVIVVSPDHTHFFIFINVHCDSFFNISRFFSMALSAVYDAILHLNRTRYYNQIVTKASEHDQDIPQSH